MIFIEIFLIAISLSMDAFAVSVCKGLTINKSMKKDALIIGLYFGVFQSIMPLLGYLLGSYFSILFDKVDHWVAFILLFIIGIGMIKNSFSKDKSKIKEGTNFKDMLLLAVATSVDALAVGVTFAFLKVNIFIAITLIGIICLVISFLGVKIGAKFGRNYENKASFLGGLILIFIGLKILFNHLGFF